MDMWIVATAAGAGCLAKYYKKLLKDGNNSSQLSSRNYNFEEPESPDHPFHRTAQRKKASEDVFADKGGVLNGSSSVITQSASTGGNSCENWEILESYQDCNDLTISNFPVESSRNVNLQTFRLESSLDGNMDDSVSDMPTCSSSRELNCFQPTLRNAGSLRSKHSYRRFVKPLSSLESCVMSHLYKEHAEMEEYILHSLPSKSSSAMRRPIVNDGIRRISDAARDSFSLHVDVDASNFHKEAFFEKNRNVYGVPLLPKIQSLKNSGIIKAVRRQDGGASGASQMRNENFFHTKGFPDHMIIFFLGICIGLISSSMENKCEVGKLKELLNHTENLVQDLQEELEMKDSMTVKELSNENCESQGLSENSFHGATTNEFFPEQNLDSSAKGDGKDLEEHKAENNSESLSKIEAELEAELQRLGLNIDASNVDRKFSDLPEIDPEFVRNFSEGELRANQLQQNEDVSQITNSGNYLVSPWELSLRLHEVIESRLETRVRELEAALEKSERKLQLIETKHQDSSNGFMDSELQYSSSEESSHIQPLVMNLTGEALDEYNEAYIGLANMDDSEEELMNSPSGINESKHQQSQIAVNGYPFSVMNGTTNGSTTIAQTIYEENIERDNLHNFGTKKGYSSTCEESNEANGSGDESSDYDEEMEKQLIKQIVEKTRKGSPVVRNAQKWLFSTDKDDG